MVLNFNDPIFRLKTDVNLCLGISFFLLVYNTLSGQMIPKFDRTLGDTLVVTDRIPVLVPLSVGLSDPALITLKSPDLSSYMISRLNDTMFVLNIRGALPETKLKLYFKSMPVDVIPVVYKPLNLPQVVLKEYAEFPRKGLLATINHLDCDIDENFKIRYNVLLHSFDIQIHHPSGRKEFLNNYGGNIVAPNLSKIKSLPPNTVIVFGNLKLRTIFNSIVDLQGESNKFIVKE